MNQIKIAAVVVSHNRLSLLKQSIEALRHQSFKIFEIIVVDNSSDDGTLDWLNSQNDLTVIVQDNLGSSGGQYSGIQRAIEDESELIWCLEDEVFAEYDCLKKLIDFYITKEYKVSAVAAVRKDVNGSINFGEVLQFNPNKIKHSKRYVRTNLENYNQLDSIEIYAGTFEGLLINARAVIEKGLPNKEMFLWFDDVEFCSRLNKYYPIYSLRDAVVRKNSVIPATQKGNIVKSTIMKELYGFRNLIFIETNILSSGAIEFIKKHLSIIFYYLRIIKYYLNNFKLFYKSNFKLIKFMYYSFLCLIKGYRHKLGKLNFKP